MKKIVLIATNEKDTLVSESIWLESGTCSGPGKVAQCSTTGKMEVSCPGYLV